MPIDLPVEFGYRCPICMVTDERLHWSEYNFMLWCQVCNNDWPTALCVNLRWKKAEDWQKGGPEDAVTVFLTTVEEALAELRVKQRDEVTIEALELIAAMRGTKTRCAYDGRQQCWVHNFDLAPCPFEQADEFLAKHKPEA